MFKWKIGTALFNYTMHTSLSLKPKERNYTKAAYPTDAVYRKWTDAPWMQAARNDFGSSFLAIDKYQHDFHLWHCSYLHFAIPVWTFCLSSNSCAANFLTTRAAACAHSSWTHRNCCGRRKHDWFRFRINSLGSVCINGLACLAFN